MRPCGATRAGTQAPPLPISIIFFRTIPHNQNNHLHAICPNNTHHPHAIHQTKSPIPRATCPNAILHSHAIHPNETVGAVPVCPPERPRSGVFIPKIHALCVGNLTPNAPLLGDTGGHTGTAPTNLHQTMRRSITSSHYTFDSPRQPHGVPLPHRGYTFDSAGLASATLPTLGNDVREEATPLGVVLFLIAHHYHTRQMISSHEI